mmetsp:Transcript_19340/g.47403  ORF Transcript_19340/g.47403 Transcript_19340/m.47403 type:complete len:389 (+) Transcript_19340:442-1608(+)
MSDIAKFSKPTDIQKHAWPLAMKGLDIIGIAQTGSGKTLSYLLPTFIQLKRNEVDPKANGPAACVLAPTRELCHQIGQEAERFGKPAGIESAMAYGGTKRSDQLWYLKRGPHMVIACPGRLNDFLNAGDVSLRECHMVTLDEADRMLDMGFKPQIEQVLANLPEKDQRQMMMFTATWPRDIRTIAQEFFEDPVQIQAGTGDSLTANKNIRQLVEIVERENDKWAVVEKVLQQGDPGAATLIFCKTKRLCRDLARHLSRKGFGAVELHGDLEQRERDYNMNQFRQKRNGTRVLVATAVAERGLDIPEVGLVLNFDAPDTAEDYVHRIGRTGRAGALGTAITFLTKFDGRKACDIKRVMMRAGMTPPRDLDAMAQEAMDIEREKRTRSKW